MFRFLPILLLGLAVAFVTYFVIAMIESERHDTRQANSIVLEVCGPTALEQFKVSFEGKTGGQRLEAAQDLTIRCIGRKN